MLPSRACPGSALPPAIGTIYLSSEAQPQRGLLHPLPHLQLQHPRTFTACIQELGEATWMFPSSSNEWLRASLAA